jgi:hypothetical protein
MAINFNRNSIFDLKPINGSDIRPEVSKLLIDGEKVLYAFKTIRDQLIFTNKRIISIDVQGITGKRKEFATMPYSKIQFFTVQTPAFMEIISDAELYIMFSNGFEATFEFKNSKVDIVGDIAKVISNYIL